MSRSESGEHRSVHTDVWNDVVANAREPLGSRSHSCSHFRSLFCCVLQQKSVSGSVRGSDSSRSHTSAHVTLLLSHNPRSTLNLTLSLTLNLTLPLTLSLTQRE